jgi:hypothetical protein
MQRLVYNILTKGMQGFTRKFEKKFHAAGAAEYISRSDSSEAAGAAEYNFTQIRKGKKRRKEKNTPFYLNDPLALISKN